MLWVRIWIRASLKFVSDLRQVSGFLRVLRQCNWLPRYNWNIVERSVKDHKTKPTILQLENFWQVFTAFGQLKVGTTSPIGQVCKKVNVKPWYLPYFFIRNVTKNTSTFPPLIKSYCKLSVIYVSTRAVGIDILHPEALLYSLRRSRRFYSIAVGWYNLNAHG